MLKKLMFLALSASTLAIVGCATTPHSKQFDFADASVSFNPTGADWKVEDGYKSVRVKKGAKPEQDVFEDVRDFVILHYKATRRDDSDFWKQCANMSIPDSLAGRIDQFRNKARVFADAELFNTVSWVSVMLGQGIVPDEYEPVVDGLDERKVADALEQMRAAIVEIAGRLATHEEFIANCLAQPSAEQRPQEIVF